MSDFCDVEDEVDVLKQTIEVLKKKLGKCKT